MPPTQLHDVQLDRQQLNIFVCGPGYGETIVIALPERGWIVIDGAGSKGDYPAHEILKAHSGDEPIDLVLLTHPHRDHRSGLRALLCREHARIGKLGCVASYVDGAPAKPLAEELAARESQSNTGSDDELVTGELRGLFERIRALWAEQATTRLNVHDGAKLALSSPKVTAKVLAPTQRDVAVFFGSPQLRGSSKDANDLSGVLELQFGDARYLFGGDLPDTTPRGWPALLARHRGLHQHSFLKLPHHGSDGAQPTGLLSGQGGSTRTWALTPFCAGSQLPSFDPQRGVHRLLRHEPSLFLTALPRTKTARTPMPDQTPVGQVHDGLVALRGSIGKGVKPRPAGRAPNLRATDAFWLLSFEANGRRSAAARGAVSTELVR